MLIVCKTLNIPNQLLFRVGTEAKIGEDYSDYSVKVGTIRMREHPNFHTLENKINQQEFEIRETELIGGKEVEVENVRIENIKLIDANNQYLGAEKILYAKPNMRYLDLEHEVGHIEQLSKLANAKLTKPSSSGRDLYTGILYTGIIEIKNNGTRKQWKPSKCNNQIDIMKDWQNIILEYDNRLQEFLRLHERNATSELLREHSQRINLGVDYWKEESDKIVARKRSRKEWAQDNFSEVMHGSNLRQKYEAIIGKT